MRIEEIIEILENRIQTLTETRKLAVQAGSLEQVANIDFDLVSTQASIEQLKKTG